MRKIYAMLCAVLLVCVSARGQQIVTTSPSPLQQGSADVSITYYADQGNKGLLDCPATDPVYAHIGVITNLSDGGWAYAPQWGDNAAKYKCVYVGTNTWRLDIGDIRTYFGITNPDEVVEKLAMVFRNGNCSREGKTATGGDIFVDVMPDGFQLDLSSSAGSVVNSQNNSVTFTVGTTAPADISLYVNDQQIATAIGATSLVKSYTLTPGDYTVRAEATSGSQSATKELTICYPKNSDAQPYPGGEPQMGAVAAADGSVTFCLAAPGKTNAMIIGSWNGYKPGNDGVMHYVDVDGVRYFWTTVSGLDATTDYPYYYLIDESVAVGDPYARLVLDPYNDKWLSDGTYPGLMPYPEEVEGNVMLAVYNGARDDYDWQVDDFVGVDQSDLIIYELLLRDFTGTEGKAYGNGTLRKAMKKLDYLERLGVNAIELMPIQEFNGNNSWGYNTNFYFAPDKAYGSPDDYRAFIDECHSRGIAVILDVVFNQSDGMHPWYQMYAPADNPFYNQRAPHAYSVLNDWLQDNMLVQQQWHDMLRYWLTAYRVDGFRFDLVKGLGDNASYGGNASEANTNKYNTSRIERMKELTEVMHSVNPHAYSINENLAGAQEENAMAANGQLNWANINDAACQYAMGYSSDSNCNRFYAPDDQRMWGSTVSYAESHDEQRVAYKQDQWGVASVKGHLDMSMRRLGSLAAQMLLSPGAHMIWQFGELGNATSTKNADGSNNTDPKPVLWSYYDQPDRRGLYDSYRQLISLRTLNPELFAQDATYSMACGASNWVTGRYIYASTDQKEMICVINPEEQDRTYTGVTFKSADNARYQIVSQSYQTNCAFDASKGTVSVPAGGYVVITSGEVAGTDGPSVAPSTVTVGSGDGAITINGTYRTARVYTLSGIEVGNPGAHLSPGLYIVVVDGQPHKVAVR